MAIPTASRTKTEFVKGAFCKSYKLFNNYVFSHQFFLIFFSTEADVSGILVIVNLEHRSILFHKAEIKSTFQLERNPVDVLQIIPFEIPCRHRITHIPVYLAEAKMLADRLAEEEKIGIVPEGVLPAYCGSWFPNEHIIDYMNLPSEDREKFLPFCTWYEERPTVLACSKDRACT